MEPDNPIIDERDPLAAGTAKPVEGDEEPRRKTRRRKASSEESTAPRAAGIDSRIKVFAGIVMTLIAGYLLVVSISYFSNATHDQSRVISNTIMENVSHADQIRNTGGPLGAYLSETLISGWMGVGTFILIFYVGALALTLMNVHRFKFWTLTLKCLLLSISLSMVVGLVTYGMSMPFFWGGAHGYYLNKALIDVSGIWGCLIVDIIIVVLTLLLFYSDLHKAYVKYRKHLEARRARMAEERRRAVIEQREADSRRLEREAAEHRAATEEAERQRQAELAAAAQSPLTAYEAAYNEELVGDAEQPVTDILSTAEEVGLTINAPAAIEEVEEVKNDTYDPTAELSRFRFPSLDLLHDRAVKDNNVDVAELEGNKKRITMMLNQFGVGISHIEATVGATVTLFEIIPAEGVRISQIKHLEDDLALQLAALGIRIIAPIPGKGTIGLEVPNKEPQMVPIRSVLASRKYNESRMELPMAMGTTIQNEVFMADLTKMPHLLVAGATGMGKSVGLNTIIASLLYKKHPAELKFVLVDPKMVEFSLYAKLERHYLAKLPEEEDAIITDPKKVVTTLNSLCQEMDDRYRLLKDAKVRNIKEYNGRFVQRRLNPDKGHRYLPYIVVIVDEFADLIMTAGKEVETPIARLAQKARAIGIHLILATQRPSANVITGVIKANFPGRIAFRVSQMVDSRTILDRPGANQLLGKGDMLFSRDGEITRMQCAFIDTDEVEAICDSIDGQVGYEGAYPLPEYVPEVEGGDGSGGGGNTFGERDPMFDEAARLVVTSGVASTSSLQRRYSIGYNRAGKIMDQMEAAGIVGPSQGGKPRQVLVTDMATLEAIISQ